LKASIADAEAQVGELEKHLEGESNGQGATAASPAPGSQTATFANAGEAAVAAPTRLLNAPARRAERLDLADQHHERQHVELLTRLTAPLSVGRIADQF